MPLGRGVKYRWKTFSSGKKVRLAFKKGKVIEVKPLGGRAERVKSSKHKKRHSKKKRH